jgi:2-aminoadipate transaminase
MLPKPELDAGSDVPLYRQLYAYVRDLINAGRLGNGEKLPATRELAGLLGLNRTTVSAAYELLETEGFISGHVGRGSFVTARRPQPDEFNWAGLIRAGQAAPAPSITAGPDVISFATSRPAEQLFPLDEFRASCEEVLASPELPAILQLGAPSGYAPLRRFLTAQARVEGLLRPEDELIVTSGCQQGLDLVGRVVLRPGDKVAVEDPVYPGLSNLFREYGAEMIPVPVGDSGLDLEILARVLASQRPKLLVVTPNFQNPTGATLPLDARRTLLKLAHQGGAGVIENDIYGELRYEGDPLPTLKQLDGSGRVILLRSFSKLTFPGLRVGWITGPGALIARLAEAKHLADLHTDQFSQAVLLRFAESGRLDRHRSRVLQAGSERLKAVLRACDRWLPAGTRTTRPHGGMNCWVRLPEPLDAAELLPRVQRENVAYLPGRYFLLSKAEPGSLRLSFAGLPPELIEEGVRRLGLIFGSELARERARVAEPASALV